MLFVPGAEYELLDVYRLLLWLCLLATLGLGCSTPQRLSLRALHDHPALQTLGLGSEEVQPKYGVDSLLVLAYVLQHS